MITLSLANSMSFIEILVCDSLAALIAASLIRFSKSAPEKPGVDLATVFNSTSESKGTFLE